MTNKEREKAMAKARSKRLRRRVHHEHVAVIAPAPVGDLPVAGVAEQVFAMAHEAAELVRTAASRASEAVGLTPASAEAPLK